MTTHNTKSGKSGGPDDPSDPNGGETRCGFVAVIGAPNAGKSTLVNLLVGAKVSIVTHKVQTTRTRVMGIAMKGQAQIVFIDTPGIFQPKRRLDRAMVGAAWMGVDEADQTVFLIDASVGLNAENQAILDGLVQRKAKAVLALNKIDLVKREKLLELAATLNESGAFTDTFMISALKGYGAQDLLDHLAANVSPGPWMFPEDQLSDMPQMLLAAEVTREKLFLNVHQELPYATTVETELWEPTNDGGVKIEQTIYVARDSQKAIILGKGGQRVKVIGKSAREELVELLGCPVHLYLFVKVRERWQDDPARYRVWNLDFNA
ncbi:GTPase Era [Hwanghaeella grinnelliae]|uniref:GTPase Era n=1 Tax=Hwanghaeella grinnelliae TaxID=2500179 RepID=A0A3S3USI0_9PROT|nr:GTPase Era [Hwanghaeella grinnelliae]RVU39523.1 GTPase Era [Hwanghaeella grinnelliae]